MTRSRISAKDLIGYQLTATDGEVGKVKDLFFDDETWSVRYLVVDTGSWLDSREVLISPVTIAILDPQRRIVQTSLTRQQVEESPPVLADAPVSRLYEEQLHRHYGWPYYWGDSPFGASGLSMYPPVGDLGLFPGLGALSSEAGVTPEPAAERESRQALEQRLDAADPHLCSARDVRGYRVRPSDGRRKVGDSGQVDDLSLDGATWRLTHVIVDTGNWFVGRKVPVEIDKVNHVDWSAEEVILTLTKGELKAAAEQAVDRPPAGRKSPPATRPAGSKPLHEH